MFLPSSSSSFKPSNLNRKQTKSIQGLSKLHRNQYKVANFPLLSDKANRFSSNLETKVRCRQNGEDRVEESVLMIVTFICLINKGILASLSSQLKAQASRVLNPMPATNHF